MRKRFANTYKTSNGDIKKLNLLFRAGACPYEYMDYWQKSSETPLPDKKGFYINLNMEYITAADYMQGKEFARILK